MADAKEVGMGYPAEETYCHPNQIVWNLHLFYQKPGKGQAVLRNSSNRRIQTAKRPVSVKPQAAYACS